MTTEELCSEALTACGDIGANPSSVEKDDPVAVALKSSLRQIAYHTQETSAWLRQLRQTIIDQELVIERNTTRIRTLMEAVSNLRD